MNITFRGKTVSLAGTPLKTGEPMPDFTLYNRELQPVHGDALSGVRIFLTVPSLDTGVCDQEVRRFNQEAARFPDVHIYAVSLDLPFAQARWCAGAGIQHVTTLSDYMDHRFGEVTGTRIMELGLLTRAVLIVTGDGKLAYVEYVPEVTEHPDYEAALACIGSIT